MSSNASGKYVSTIQRARQETYQQAVKKSVYGVQSGVVEIIRNHFINVDATKLGLNFPQTWRYKYPDNSSPDIADFRSEGDYGSYIHDFTNSDIIITPAFEGNVKEPGKRPIIVVHRGEAVYKAVGSRHSVMQFIPEESIRYKVYICEFPLSVKISTPEIGVCEYLTDFTLIPLLAHAEEICEELCLSTFKVKSVSSPSNDVAKNQPRILYTVSIDIECSFNKAFPVIGDDLKLHEVSVLVHDPSNKNTILKDQ